MKRQHILLLLIAGLAAMAVVMSLVWCPPAACRVLHIQTYTISSLDEYRQFLRDEAAFTALHHVRAVRMNCSDLREAVVTALNTNRLMSGRASRMASHLRAPHPAPSKLGSRADCYICRRLRITRNSTPGR